MSIQNRIVIDPRNYRTDKVYVGFLSVFLVIWASITFYVTYRAITEPNIFFYGWLIFGYVGTILIPYCLFFMNNKEIIECSDNCICIYKTRIFTTKQIKINNDIFKALTLEHYDETDTESVYSLNLIYNKGILERRVMLAAFVHPKDKNEIFVQIESFLKENGLNFKSKNTFKSKA